MSGDDLFPAVPRMVEEARRKAAKPAKPSAFAPPNLGKAVRLPVPDFSLADRPKTCLEVDFPIAPINALSHLEGNAGKPIYQMSKWWARRRSSVFRSLLISAAVRAPEDPTQAGSIVWDHYYANHQEAGSFKNLRVLDCFMGGGTTLVEGARLGFQVVGVDLNPVAWFVTKNELACTDPARVREFFGAVEAEVRPQVQPFYATSCPRDHKGRWIETRTGTAAEVDPLRMAPDERRLYRWEGPEVIYTFWAKHGPCKAEGCGHRTPVFRSPLIAEKRISVDFIPLTCPSCAHAFGAELGDARMAPGAERVVAQDEAPFTECSPRFAALLNTYGQGNAAEKRVRPVDLLARVDAEPGLRCPKCRAFAGEFVRQTLHRHAKPSAKTGEIRKKDFGIQSRRVQLYLLVRPEWLAGSEGPGLGGFAGASPDATAAWYERRLDGLRLVEVRGRVALASADTEPAPDDLEANADEAGAVDEDADRKKYGPPPEIVLADGTRMRTRAGTVPKRSHFTCARCGLLQDFLTAVKATGRTAPVAPYALQGYCPECEEEGRLYSGRWFKAPDSEDAARLAECEREWASRSSADLAGLWPHDAELPYAWMTHHLNGGIPNWGYTHWWKMFNPRQLLVHAQLLRAILTAGGEAVALDVREQAMGAFQQYLRMMNMFSFWHQSFDKLAPFMSNANYHPKQQVVETNVFGALGYGRWLSCTATVREALDWCREPWDLSRAQPGSRGPNTRKVEAGDAVIATASGVYCGSATDLSILGPVSFDLVITDPPFGDNLFYADCADFFYVWLRLGLLKLYAGRPERAWFEPRFTPRTLEAIRNRAEHPDNRTPEEVDAGAPEPASGFYKNTLTACWAEAARLLKPGGLLAFTFHHSEDEPWLDVLEALFDAGYVLVATYPIRSDETKGDGAFGSKKIEYDIVHVCRKRTDPPQRVSWARMRQWVREEVARLRLLLRHYAQTALPASDIRVILRGKALEFYSRHYGQVFTGAGDVLGVRDALLGINQVLDDQEDPSARRPPQEAHPVTREFLKLFAGRPSLPRDELHKLLRGTGVSGQDLERNGWIRAAGTTIHAVPVSEHFQFFTQPGRNRRILKSDLDQAHFLVGAAVPNSGVSIEKELNDSALKMHPGVPAILRWFSETDPGAAVRQAAGVALGIVERWLSEDAARRRALEEAEPDLFQGRP